jgi:hypothetical protein
VINPTVKSILAAIKRYEEEGGTGSMYVNDDGMQLLADEYQQYDTFWSKITKLLADDL